MESHYIEGSREVAASPETVWALLAKPERWHDTITPYIKWIRMNGPLQVGTTALVRTRVPPLRSSWVVTCFEEGRRWSWRGRVLGLSVIYHHIVEPTDTGSRITLRVEADGRVAEAMRKMLRRLNLPQMETALGLIKELAEAEVEAARGKGHESVGEATSETSGRDVETDLSVSEALESIPIGPGDPLESTLLSIGGPVDLSTLSLESKALQSLRSAGVEMVVPLIGQGELLGALYLGPRLSDQPYSTDDRRLLSNLASQVAPAMKVAQLVREQQAEAKERERIQQELQVAALIQQTLLPKELPSMPGWQVEAFYRPARAVGGDFYDFVELGGDRLGFVIGDVTDKGVPAALVMATCRSMLRAAAARHDSPAAVLGEVNDKLVPEIPPAMFVTCLYAIVDTRAGEIVFANAGHNLPYVRSSGGVSELRATGMPLGLMPDMEYEEKTHRLDDGDVMVLTSDGITEAHSPEGEMYGFSRLMGQVANKSAEEDMVSTLVGDLERWTGGNTEQEDDITLVVVRRTASARESARAFSDEGLGELASFAIPSVEGNERAAIARVVDAVGSLDLTEAKLEKLKTAVGETVMNAIEHGNEGNPDLDVTVRVAMQGDRLSIRVTDQGGDKPLPETTKPDLEAKVAGTQSPRGWGLFLVGQMVDEVRTESANGTRTVELLIDREGAA